jgi:hypothetical protein
MSFNFFLHFCPKFSLAFGGALQKTLRYQLLKLAGKLVLHARYMILQIAAPLKNMELFRDAYYRVKLAPMPLRL